MKKIFIPFFVLACLFLVAGCSTKFNIAAPYKNITVIYGMLDEADSSHYVRIEKAFLSQNQSALTMAQDADSSFYPSLNVRIKRYDYSGNYIDSIILNKVDLDTVPGYHKIQNGVFFSTPNYAYRFNNLLNPNYIYQIMVTNPANNETDSASAPVLDDLNLAGNSPTTFYIDVLDNILLSRAGMDFASTLPSMAFRINMTYYPPSNFNFESLQTPAYMTELIFRFHWNDSNITTHTQVADSFDYDAGFQLLSSNANTYQVNDLSFYSAIANGMGTAPANTYRLLDRCQILAYVTTLEYNNYYQNSLTQGVGLTGGEIEPSYTNIQGTNTLGLFTSKGYRIGWTTITANTVDSLEASPFTQNAKIVGTVYH